MSIKSTEFVDDSGLLDDILSGAEDLSIGFKSKPVIFAQDTDDYLLDIMKLNNLVNENTLFVDLINDCNYCKDKY